jgi:hypothetical protein
MKKFDREHKPIDVDEVQRKNLTVLAKDLFLHEENFDMKLYATKSFLTLESSEITVKKVIDKTICGAIVCAVGRAAVLGLTHSNFFYNRSTSWQQYSKIVLGAPVYSHMFDWCFDSDWVIWDNTSKGAAYRILYSLEHGCPISSPNAYLNIYHPFGDEDRIDECRELLTAKGLL